MFEKFAELKNLMTLASRSLGKVIFVEDKADGIQEKIKRFKGINLLKKVAILKELTFFLGYIFKAF